MNAQRPDPLTLAAMDRELARFLLRSAEHYARVDNYSNALAAIDRAAGLLHRAANLTDQEDPK